MAALPSVDMRAEAGASSSLSFSKKSRRNILSFFAANADAFIEFQVVADHADIAQGLGAVAYQGGIAHRARELAVLDQVAFRRRENEITAGDIDLPAAEIHAVNAFRD